MLCRHFIFRHIESESGPSCIQAGRRSCRRADALVFAVRHIEEAAAAAGDRQLRGGPEAVAAVVATRTNMRHLG
eukprot:6214149-Pleurochrysis_carterae.AAC.2